MIRIGVHALRGPAGRFFDALKSADPRKFYKWFGTCDRALPASLVCPFSEDPSGAPGALDLDSMMMAPVRAARARARVCDTVYVLID